MPKYGTLINRRRGRVIKTGQETQYSSELDDGYYEKGLARSYTVLTTGQYSGTVNIDVAHYTSGAGAVTFDNVAKTIVDTGNGLAIFKTGDVITTDDADNPGPFTVTTGNVAGTITCTGATFVTKTPAGTVTLKKREAHSNNCVLDNNTGLTWSRYVSDKMGAASDGKMEWTDVPYDIFAYCAAAIAASLGGHTDWRVANEVELATLPIRLNGANCPPDATAFPSWPAATIWSSGTRVDNTAQAFNVNFTTGHMGYDAKTTQYQVALVRGG